MRAITLHQPWASLIAVGAKRIETRSWATKHRGPLAIHAGKKNVTKDLSFVIGAKIQNALPFVPEDAPTGVVVAIADLIDCIEMTDEWIGNLPQQELAFGWFDIGRYAWILANVRRIEPVAAKGTQGLWNWDEYPEVTS